MPPRYDIRISHYQFKRAYGASWLRIFYQRKYSYSEGFDSKSQCYDYVSDSMYSILGNASEYSPFGDKYEFLLEYPEIEGYNRWKQTDFPTKNKEKVGVSPVKGYENVSISWNIQYWGGLSVSLSPTSLLDGSIGNYYFWFSICYLKNVGDYDDKMPGPSLIHEVILWMRVSDIFFPTYANHRFFLTHLVFSLVTIFAIINC